MCEEGALALQLHPPHGLQGRYLTHGVGAVSPRALALLGGGGGGVNVSPKVWGKGTPQIKC